MAEHGEGVTQRHVAGECSVGVVSAPGGIGDLDSAFQDGDSVGEVDKARVDGNGLGSCR